MNPLLIGALSLSGAGLIAFWCSFARLWWPLTALAALLAVIALQLRAAVIGDGIHHDLSAWMAMQATVIPALAGVMIGGLAGQGAGQGFPWRRWQGVVTGLLLVVAAGAVVMAGLI